MSGALAEKSEPPVGVPAARAWVMEGSNGSSTAAGSPGRREDVAGLRPEYINLVGC